MAIPDNYIDKITKDGESRMISPAADKVRVNNEHYEGDNLDDVLDEITEAIGDAGSGDGTVKGVKVGSTTYEPDSETGVVDLSTPIAGKVDKVPGKGLSTNDYTDAEKTKLQNLPTADGLTQQLNSKANAAEVVPNTRKVNNKPLSSDVTIGMSDIPGLEEAIGQIEAGTTVVINSDGVNINDDVSDSILTAPSSRLLKELYLNLKALYNPTSGLAGIAFLNGKPDWQTVDVPEHTITLDTMTNVSASLNGTSINDNISADEGEVTILLTPSSNNYMSSISIKDGSNHDVNFTRNDVSGGTEITFILYGNVTISASASSGIQVNVSGTGITSYTTGVQPNIAAQLNIALPEHHTWGTVTVSYGGTDITSQCNISPANNANKVITLPNTLSDMSKVISIVANAVEDDFAVLDLDEVGSNVAIMRDSESLLGQSTPPHVYAGETISILPVGNNKVSATVTIGGNAVTLDGNTYNGFTYTLQSNDVNSSGTSIAIAANATGLVDCAITLPTIGNGIASVALTDLEDNAIELNNNVYSVLENTGIKIVLTPDTDYVINNISIANMNEGDDYNVTDSNGVKTIIIDHVTANVVLTATASMPNKVNVTYNLRNMVVSTDNAVNGMVNEGGTFEATLDTAPMSVSYSSGSPSILPLYGNGIVGEWATPSVVVKKGGVDITTTAFDAETKQIAIDDVDADIEITAICEPKIFRNTNNAGTTVSVQYPEAKANYPFGVNSIYLHVPYGCSKIRWCHNAKKTGKSFFPYEFRPFDAKTNGGVNQWASVIQRLYIGGTGGQVFDHNYNDYTLSTPISHSRVFAIGAFAQNYLSGCFAVDTTNVNATALSAADQAAVDEYNQANGTSYTTSSRVVGASLDTIVSLGGKVIFDGRYSALADLPS